MEGSLAPAVRGREAEPLGPAPDHVAGAEADEGDVEGPALEVVGGVGDAGAGGAAREAVRHVLQADVGAVALDQQGHDAVDAHVGGQQHREPVAVDGDLAQRGPGRRRGPRLSPVLGGDRHVRDLVAVTVALGVLAPPYQTQGDPRADVG